jgi:hypothetical protein
VLTVGRGGKKKGDTSTEDPKGDVWECIFLGFHHFSAFHILLIPARKQCLPFSTPLLEMQVKCQVDLIQKAP